MKQNVGLKLELSLVVYAVAIWSDTGEPWSLALWTCPKTWFWILARSVDTLSFPQRLLSSGSPSHRNRFVGLLDAMFATTRLPLEGIDAPGRRDCITGMIPPLTLGSRSRMAANDCRLTITGPPLVLSAFVGCCRRCSSSSFSNVHSCGCLTTRNCCCGPTMLPGRQIRHHAMASRAENRYFFIRYAAIFVPVRPSPALQWTATAPDSRSHTYRSQATSWSAIHIDN
jgi:hypothetical protein